MRSVARLKEKSIKPPADNSGFEPSPLNLPRIATFGRKEHLLEDVDRSTAVLVMMVRPETVTAGEHLDDSMVEFNRTVAELVAPGMRERTAPQWISAEGLARPGVR